MQGTTLILAWVFDSYLQLKTYNQQLLYAGVTVDPTRSPSTTRLIFPCLFMLNTTIGMLLSMHSEIAVESITFKFCCSTSRYVMRSKNFASTTCSGSAS